MMFIQLTFHVGLLDRIMASSDPESILADLKAIKGHLPANDGIQFGYFQLTLLTL